MTAGIITVVISIQRLQAMFQEVHVIDSLDTINDTKVRRTRFEVGHHPTMIVYLGEIYLHRKSSL